MAFTLPKASTAFSAGLPDAGDALQGGAQAALGMSFVVEATAGPVGLLLNLPNEGKQRRHRESRSPPVGGYQGPGPVRSSLTMPKTGMSRPYRVSA